MKLKGLIILLLICIGNTLLADNSIARNILHKGAKNITHTSKLLESLSSSNRVAKVLNVFKRNNELVFPSVVFMNDSTKRLVYLYDNNGNALSEITEDKINNNWVSVKRIFVSFDLQGNLLTYKEEHIENDIWVIFSNFIISYDSNGNQVSIEYQSIDLGEHVSGIISNSYNSSNLITTSLNERNLGDSKENFELIEYTYNSNKKLANVIVKTWNFNQQWNNSFQEIFEYNNTGLVETHTFKSWNNNIWENTVKENYTYNNFNKVSTKTNEVAVAENWLNDSRDSYTYNTNGSLSNYQEDIWQNGAWVSLTKTDYLYNSNGNLIISRKEDYTNNTWQLNTKTNYTYNNENNFISGNCIVFQNDSWVSGLGVFMAIYNQGQDTLYYYGKNINIDLLKITETEEIVNNVSTFSLAQNYPNPFNPSTNINFTLPNSEFVTLKVYDILGKEITTLISEQLDAGNHINTFDATKFSSGVYFYTLQAGKFNETKKMILIR